MSEEKAFAAVAAANAVAQRIKNDPDFIQKMIHDPDTPYIAGVLVAIMGYSFWIDGGDVGKDSWLFAGY
jgi:hypothetical protein